MNDDEIREFLLGALAAKRDGAEDRFVTFEDRADLDTHLLVPYRTRFNSPSRVRKQRERVNVAWRAPADCFNRSVVLTLTVDPARFGDGACAPSVVVPEFTERGVLHVHVVLFGVACVPHAPLAHY